MSVPSLLSAGSSPRVWGPLMLAKCAESLARFIPTRVGTTRRVSRRAICPCGSSPRVWGPRDFFPLALFALRFIPTRVGTTPAPPPALPSCPVHPHACGDHGWKPSERLPPSGSSPRVWGPPVVMRPPALPPRFIPTRVGTTPRHVESPSVMTVHPHACGDHAVAHYASRATSGSSPRVWGPLVDSHVELAVERFIPTRVGTTTIWRICAGVTWVHPHACGDHVSSTTNCPSSAGSSPRVWGPLQ